jgi:DNA-binding SARP family transcriptional activator
VRNGHDGTRLIEHALRRLLPDVFFHPVWTHVVEADVLPPEQVQSLLGSVDQMLSAGKLHDACQTLFICAFQQLRSGDHAAASNTIQRIHRLAVQHELSQVAACAAWGAAAICAQCGWHQQAAGHLEQLHAMLGQQHEWILSDVIDVLRQDLLSQAEVIPADRLLSSEAALSPAFEQLLHWGTPRAVRALGANGLIGHDGHTGHATSLSGTARFTRHSLWQTIKRIVKGELRLKWVDVADLRQSCLFDEPGKQYPSSEAPALVPTRDQIAPITPSPDEVHKPIEQMGAAPKLATGPSTASPTLTVYTLGTFHLAVNDIPANHTLVGRSRLVFEYLLIHHDQPVARDMLMDVFWPNVKPGSARNRLNVALHHMRQALRTITDIPIVLFEEGAYCINPEFDVWIDAEEFDRHVKKGRQLEAASRLDAAIQEYEIARDIYHDDFLADEPYEDWPVLLRERLRADYLNILDRLSQIYFDQREYAACAALSQLILSRDNCREEAHCRIMQCYSRQNQRYLALRQYQICLKALRTELDVGPASSTTQLYECLRRREPI